MDKSIFLFVFVNHKGYFLFQGTHFFLFHREFVFQLMHFDFVLNLDVLFFRNEFQTVNITFWFKIVELSFQLCKGISNAINLFIFLVNFLSQLLTCLNLVSESFIESFPMHADNRCIQVFYFISIAKDLWVLFRNLII